MRAPVKSNKHELTWSNLGQDAGTAAITINIAKGTDAADLNTADEVGIGDRLTSVYFEFHFSPAQTGNVNVIHWQIGYANFGQVLPNPNAYQDPRRSQIIKRGMEMLPQNVATVYKRIFVIKIPKKYLRQRDSSTLVFMYQASSTQTINACGIAIYKSFS